jgi:hypothetical protein
MNDHVSHTWALDRLTAWRSGLLGDDDAARVAAHVDGCERCRALADAFRVAHAPDSGQHVPAAMLAVWPRAARELRGLERTLVRHHLERCAECRQDLELLGHEPRLAHDPALDAPPVTVAAPEQVYAAEPIATDPPPRTAIIKVVRPARAATWRDRGLVAWSCLATAAALIAIVMHVRRPVVEGVPPLVIAASPTGARAPGDDAGVSVRIAPRPRKLSGPTHGDLGGKLNVIPVVGPVSSLALSIRPLSIPDTSLVMISLLNSQGDTLFAVRHRQWEFFPKRVLMIDGAREPLRPGQYALVLASLIGQEGRITPLMSRYRFELRPRIP